MTAAEAIKQADEILPYAKVWVRKTLPQFDDEVRQTLAACLLDLQNAGVGKLSVTDPLIQQAAKLYLKAHFGYDDKSEKWAQAYEYLKISLSMSSDYAGGVQIDT